MIRLSSLSRILVIFAALSLTSFCAHTASAQPSNVKSRAKLLTVESDGSFGSKENSSQVYAFIVGSQDYINATPLDYADADAQAFSARLQELGASAENIVLLSASQRRRLQPLKDNIEREYSAFLERLDSNDVAIVFLSGHGFQPEGGESYYAPEDIKVGSDDQIRETGILISDMMDRLAKSPARIKWMNVDACRNDPKKAAIQTRFSIDAMPDSLILLQSCTEGEFSYESDEFEHGLFTQSLLEALADVNNPADENNDGDLTIPEICKYVREHTKKLALDGFNAQQRPRYHLTTTDADQPFLSELDGVSSENRKRAQEKFKEAQALRAQKEYDAALDAVVEALSFWPGQVEYQELAETLQKESKKRGAPEEADVHYQNAKRYRLKGRYDVALEEIEEALKLAPESEEYRVYQKELKELYCEQLLRDAEKAKDAAQYDDALELCAQARQLELDDSTLIDDLEEEVKRLRDNPQTVVNSLGMEFVRIEPGTFMMGNTLTPDQIYGKWGGEKEWYERSTSRHKVTLTKAYYMGKYPVTRGDFAKFIKAKSYKTTAEKEGNAGGFDNVAGRLREIAGLYWKNPGFKQTDEHPVVCVSYEDALAFIGWLNETQKDNLPDGFKYALPTEAQWEFACRAGTTTEFFWGTNEAKDGEGYLNAADESGAPNGRKWINYFPFNDGYITTSPVGAFKPNPWGLYDMLGNVWEWCADWYGDYPTASVTDPTGPTSGSYRVGRGGGWSHYAGFCRSANRSHSTPTDRDSDIGFRACLVPSGK